MPGGLIVVVFIVFILIGNIAGLIVALIISLILGIAVGIIYGANEKAKNERRVRSLLRTRRGILCVHIWKRAHFTAPEDVLTTFCMWSKSILKRATEKPLLSFRKMMRRSQRDFTNRCSFQRFPTTATVWFGCWRTDGRSCIFTDYILKAKRGCRKSKEFAAAFGLE